MGKGPTATEKNVTKQLDYSTSGGSGGASKKQNSHGNKCLFSFTFDVSLDTNKASQASTSAEVVLVLALDSNSLDVFIAGSAAGSYTGSKADLIASCIKQGYIYEGVVTEVKHGPNKTTVSCDITGHTR